MVFGCLKWRIRTHRCLLAVPHEIWGENSIEGLQVVSITSISERAHDLLVGFIRVYVRCEFVSFPLFLHALSALPSSLPRA